MHCLIGTYGTTRVRDRISSIDYFPSRVSDPVFLADLYRTSLCFSLILCDREERRVGEKLAHWVVKPIAWASPTLLSVPANTIAKAMIADLYRKTTNKVDTVENAAIHHLAKELQD